MPTRSQRHLLEIQGIDSDGQTNPELAPKVATEPTIAGTAQEGQLLTGTDGTFTGPGVITVARQWYRDGVAIVGATAATYLLVGDDVGTEITFGNTATNVYGSVSVQSDPTATVIAA